MIFALNVTSAVLAIVAVAVGYMASVPFSRPRWENIPEEQYRRRWQMILIATSLALATIVAAIRIFVAYLG